MMIILKISPYDSLNFTSQRTILSTRPKREIEEAQNLQRQAKQQDLMKQAGSVSAVVTDESSVGQQSINNDTTVNQSKVNDEFKDGVIAGDLKSLLKLGDNK